MLLNALSFSQSGRQAFKNEELPPAQIRYGMVYLQFESTCNWFFAQVVFGPDCRHQERYESKESISSSWLDVAFWLPDLRKLGFWVEPMSGLSPVRSTTFSHTSLKVNVCTWWFYIFFYETIHCASLITDRGSFPARLFHPLFWSGIFQPLDWRES